MMAPDDGAAVMGGRAADDLAALELVVGKAGRAGGDVVPGVAFDRQLGNIEQVGGPLAAVVGAVVGAGFEEDDFVARFHQARGNTGSSAASADDNRSGHW